MLLCPAAGRQRRLGFSDRGTVMVLDRRGIAAAANYGPGGSLAIRSPIQPAASRSTLRSKVGMKKMAENKG
jgi:hypothetical protein